MGNNTPYVILTTVKSVLWKRHTAAKNRESSWGGASLEMNYQQRYYVRTIRGFRSHWVHILFLVTQYKQTPNW